MVLIEEIVRHRSMVVADVAAEVRGAISSASLTPAYQAALVDTLSVPGRVLSDVPDARWTQTVATCCTASGGRYDQAVVAAASIELFMVALDVLDDLEDGEETALQSRLGSPRLINVSTGLLLLAQQMLLTMPRGADALTVLLQFTLRACAGQDVDLAGGVNRSLSLEESLDVTERKSAALVAAACQIGALCGGADTGLQSVYSEFGGYMGMVAQLINDLQAIGPGAESKTDIALGRPTLPLTYAAQFMPHALDEIGDKERRIALTTQGAAQLTWAVAESFRQRAIALIPHLSSDPSHQADLTDLLPTL